MKDHDPELAALREKLARKAKLEAMTASLHAQLAKLRAEEQRLDHVRRKEQSEVERLEKASLASFFYALAGKKEEKLDRETAEAYAATLKHSAARRQAEAAVQELRALKEELSGLAGVEAHYERAFAAKAEAVKAVDPAHGAEICRIEEQLGRITAQDREIDEAITAGGAALAQISVIEGELDSAESWGTWDLLGGGLIADLAKHSHLDSAQAQVDRLQGLLGRYRTELADVAVAAEVQAQIDGFLRFADYFFDGLFADWAVLKRIRGSQEQISSVRSQVENVQRTLAGIKASLRAEAGRLKERLSEIVLQA